MKGEWVANHKLKYSVKGHILQETSPTSRPVQAFAAAAREYDITYMTTIILLGESGSLRAKRYLHREN